MSLSLSLLVVGALALLAPAASARSADISAAQEAAVRNAIDDALNNVRDIILNGDAELGIPVLDPLVVEEWDFAVDEEEPQVSAEGSLSNAKLEGLGAFVVEQSKISISILPTPRATVTVGVRVPVVSANGNYRLNGEAHTRTDIAVDAEGDFTVVVKDISFLVKAVVTLSMKVKSVDVTLGLGDVEIDVQGAGDLGDLINNEAADRIQIWFAENRSELEKQAASIIADAIESGLGKRSQLLN